jgi:hypothetical protein
MSTIFKKAVTYRGGKAKPDTIRLWTMQPSEVWDKLRAQGTLLVDPAYHSTDPDFDTDFRRSYEWLREQMKIRVPGYQGNYPWWAYDYKIDLRSWAYQLEPPGVPYIRLELAVPTEKVLLSAYGAWHAVLTPCYLPYATDEEGWEKEDEAWDAELAANGLDLHPPFPEPWHSRMVASWQRIFDVDDLRDTNTIQANFEVLALNDVVAVTEFTTRARTKR